MLLSSGSLKDFTDLSPKQMAMRKRAENRAARLLDAKSRSMGIDTESLDREIARHQAEKRQIKQEGFEEAAMTKAIKTHLDEQESNQFAEERAERTALLGEWYHQKKPINRIESDLNPKLNKPTPINPDACGIGAAQSFAGEDSGAAERNALQQAQMKEWCKLQSDDHLLVKQAERQEDLNELEMTKIINEMRKEQEFHDMASKQQALHEVQQYNQLLAKEKRLREKQEKDLESKMNEWEVSTALSDPMLAEDPRLGASALGPHRVRRDHWKGMGQAEIEDCYATVAEQREELRQRKIYEKEEDKAWAASDKALSDLIAAEQMKVVEEQIHDRYAHATELLQQKAEHKNAEAARRLQAQNKADDAFFAGFGSSGR